VVKSLPCNCPEDQWRPASSGGCDYLYSGGPLSSFYRFMEQAIPPDVELTHSRPTVHPNGSLEFGGAPPALSRYWWPVGR